MGSAMASASAPGAGAAKVMIIRSRRVMSREICMLMNKLNGRKCARRYLDIA